MKNGKFTAYIFSLAVSYITHWLCSKIIWNNLSDPAGHISCCIKFSGFIQFWSRFTEQFEDQMLIWSKCFLVFSSDSSKCKYTSYSKEGAQFGHCEKWILSWEWIHGICFVPNIEGFFSIIVKHISSKKGWDDWLDRLIFKWENTSNFCLPSHPFYLLNYLFNIKAWLSWKSYKSDFSYFWKESQHNFLERNKSAQISGSKNQILLECALFDALNGTVCRCPGGSSRGCRGCLCEERLGLPCAEHSSFQLAPSQTHHRAQLSPQTSWYHLWEHTFKTQRTVRNEKKQNTSWEKALVT